MKNFHNLFLLSAALMGASTCFAADQPVWLTTRLDLSKGKMPFSSTEVAWGPWSFYHSGQGSFSEIGVGGFYSLGSGLYAGGYYNYRSFANLHLLQPWAGYSTSLGRLSAGADFGAYFVDGVQPMWFMAPSSGLRYDLGQGFKIGVAASYWQQGSASAFSWGPTAFYVSRDWRLGATLFRGAASSVLEVRLAFRLE